MQVDPRAHLYMVRSVRRGLLARTRILQFIERAGRASVVDISAAVGLSPSTVRYHLKNMAREGVVKRLAGAGRWYVCPVEQEKLTAYE